MFLLHHHLTLALKNRLRQSTSGVIECCYIYKKLVLTHLGCILGLKNHSKDYENLSDDGCPHSGLLSHRLQCMQFGSSLHLSSKACLAPPWKFALILFFVVFPICYIACVPHPCCKLNFCSGKYYSSFLIEGVSFIQPLESFDILDYV